MSVIFSNIHKLNNERVLDFPKDLDLSLDVLEFLVLVDLHLVIALDGDELPSVRLR